MWILWSHDLFRYMPNTISPILQLHEHLSNDIQNATSSDGVIPSPQCISLYLTLHSSPPSFFPLSFKSSPFSRESSQRKQNDYAEKGRKTIFCFASQISKKSCEAPFEDCERVAWPIARGRTERANRKYFRWFEMLDLPAPISWSWFIDLADIPIRETLLR